MDTGEEIGKIGSIFNENKMTEIFNGAHLHFEAINIPFLGTGLDGRIDPILFINANLPH